MEEVAAGLARIEARLDRIERALDEICVSSENMDRHITLVEQYAGHFATLPSPRHFFLRLIHKDAADGAGV